MDRKTPNQCTQADVGGSVTADEIAQDDQYEVFRQFTNSMAPPDAVQALRRLGVPADVLQRIIERHEAESLRIRELDEPPSVYLHNRVTWYTGPDTEKDRNWPALRSTLLRKGFDEENVRAIDESSTKIVALLDHPKQTEFSTLGLVVGFVQSGKTTNFTAVMAKAADRGYKLFIVLSGIHNTLRRQTQIRLVKDLVEANPGLWHQVTDEKRDFVPPANPKAFFATKGQHLLLVVKKNPVVLRKLRNWLAKAGEYLERTPTLIIDDEADQSTVATAKINPLLYDVFDKFPKVGYVGFTATPFANLLIDPSAEKDFYPKDFIVNLPQPLGYQGPEVLFGRELLAGEDAADLPGGYDMIREVADEEVVELKPRTRKEAAYFQPNVTPSVRDAVEWFWLATAARRMRGGSNPHSTMLIHTTTETAVHEAFRNPLLELRAAMLRRLDVRDAGTVQRLRRQWEKETRRVPVEDFDEEPVPFDVVLDALHPVVSDTKVVIDNYRSTDRLDYESGPVTAIAVGGNTLSRGLTLEGLVSSLFVRAVSAYDTLLQMGRWFGYRPRYADLPRIWMTTELADWFRHLATVEAEMRLDINRYMTENVTPLTFAVRLRSHPKLAITSKAKMQKAVLAHAAYGGELVESRYFDVTEKGCETLARNAAAARSLVASAQKDGAYTPRDRAALFAGVPYGHVLDFLNAYSFHEKSADGDRDRLIAYIGKRVAAGALGRWSVGVVGNASRTPQTEPCTLGNGVSVRMIKRARLRIGTDDTAFDGIADIKTLSSRRDEVLDLSLDGHPVPERRHDILALRARQRPNEGLLLLYPIEPMSDTGTLGREPLRAPTDDVVIGVAIVFPKPRPGTEDSEIEYYSADLSDVLVEEEDVTVLDLDDDVA